MPSMLSVNQLYLLTVSYGFHAHQQHISFLSKYVIITVHKVPSTSSSMSCMLVSLPLSLSGHASACFMGHSMSSDPELYI